MVNSGTLHGPSTPRPPAFFFFLMIGRPPSSPLFPHTPLSRCGLAPRPPPPFLRLRPLGWPAGAILWKNLLAVVRTRRVRTIATGLAVGGVVVTLLSFTSREIGRAHV